MDKEPDSSEDVVVGGRDCDCCLFNCSSLVTKSSNFFNNSEQRAGSFPFSMPGLVDKEESQMQSQELHPVAITTIWLIWLSSRIEFKNESTCRRRPERELGFRREREREKKNQGLGERKYVREELGERERGSAPKERVCVQQNHQQADVICKSNKHISEKKKKKKKKVERQRETCVELCRSGGHG